MKTSMMAEHWWITGASSGIGAALARRLAQQGHRVLVSARSGDALNELATAFPEHITPMVGDMLDDAALARWQDTLNRLPPLDGVVLNAGTCEYMDVRTWDPDLFQRVLRTNLEGTVRCIGPALSSLRRRRDQGGRARLALVSSSAAWFPFPRAQAYGASKAALDYLADSLRADLASEGIAVSLISPGFVQTPLTDRNDFPMPFRISADDAARRMAQGLAAGRNRIHFPKRFTWTLKALACLPPPVRDRLAARLSRNSTP